MRAFLTRKMKLIVYFTMLTSVVIAAALGLYLVHASEIRQEEAQGKALAEARVLNAEMNAIWDYINAKQDTINYNADGAYDFKGVYCTIAAKSIAQRFMNETDYTIRYVRENPRSSTDVPDSFELEAIEAWRLQGHQEFYDVTTHEGRPALRYASALLVENDCLKCHGGPAGELDETGFIKEGFELGDLAGMASIVIPMDVYRQEIESAVLRDFVLVLTLITLVVLVIWIGLRTWVTQPLRKLDAAARRIGEGSFDTNLSDISARGEIQDLVNDFSTMSDELKGFYESLESKVSERTKELEQANERLNIMNVKLKEASVQKSNFLTIVSHELRTPLSSIIAFSDILSTSFGQETEEGQVAREIKTNGRALLDMINNIIDAAKLESGKFEFVYEQVDLVDVVAAVERIMRPLAAGKELTLTTGVDPDVPIIVSDRDALHKILANLVGNAVKFTDRGGCVSVRARIDPPSNHVRIEVSDTGVGISPCDVDKIFDRFSQADSSISRAYGGSGLGLSIVRNLAEELGGNVFVKSVPRAGSTFTVELPTTMPNSESNGGAHHEDPGR